MPTDDPTCAHFEFSRVKGLAVGALWDNDPQLYIAALVDSPIYLYRIEKIGDGGFVEKSIWIMPTPRTFKRSLHLSSRQPVHPLLYRTGAGELRKLPLQNAVPVPKRAM